VPRTLPPTIFSKDGNPISNLKDEEYREQSRAGQKALQQRGCPFNWYCPEDFTRI